jgi:hypothetical protein
MVWCYENCVLLVALVLFEWLVGLPLAVHYLQLLVQLGCYDAASSTLSQMTELLACECHTALI